MQALLAPTVQQYLYVADAEQITLRIVLLNVQNVGELDVCGHL